MGCLHLLLRSLEQGRHKLRVSQLAVPIPHLTAPLTGLLCHMAPKAGVRPGGVRDGCIDLPWADTATTVGVQETERCLEARELA